MYRIGPDAAGTCGVSQIDMRPTVTAVIAVLDAPPGRSHRTSGPFSNRRETPRYVAFDRRGASRGATLHPGGAPPNRSVRFSFRSRHVHVAERSLLVDAASGEVSAP